MNWLDYAVPAAIVGLIGTVIGLWLGHRRWAVEFRLKRRGAFDAKRHDAYRDLWSVLENAHVALRTGRPEVVRVQDLEQQVNAFRLRNAIFLDRADSKASDEYFRSMVQLAQEIAASGSRELAERFANTNLFTTQETEQINELVNASAMLEKQRERLIDRIKTVLLETSYAAKVS